MSDYDKYMHRAIDLAHLGSKAVKDNPFVGSVLVHDDRIIGEGYHQCHGREHAEVNCINSVQSKDRHLISSSQIYVTLEPCFHEGKTPPCVDLIIKHNIKKVIISNIDPNPKVAGKSITKMQDQGIEVIVGVWAKESLCLIDPFVKMMHDKKPWVHLKFAKSKYNYIADNEGQIWLSSPLSKLYVHKMRANVDAIMIGTQTALIDDPALSTRLVQGDNPLRIILDRQGILPANLKVLSDGLPSIYVSSQPRKLDKSITLLIHDFEPENQLEILLEKLYQLGIYRLLVEGGARLLSSFKKHSLWDEATVINTNHSLNEGKKAPNLTGKLKDKIELDRDVIDVIIAK